MPLLHGKASTVLIGAYNISDYCRQNTPAFQKDIPDASTYGDTAREFAVEGLRSGSITLSGLVDTADDASDEQIQAAFEDTTAVKGLTVSPHASTAGNIAYLCVFWETDNNIDNPHDELLSFGGTFQADSGLKRGHWLQALTAVTTTGDKTSVDAGAAWAAGGRANLHATAFSGTNCTIIIKDSADDISFAAVTGLAFAQFTAITHESLSIATAIRRYRLVNFAGTFTSVTAGVALGR